MLFLPEDLRSDHSSATIIKDPARNSHLQGPALDEVAIYLTKF